MTRTLHCESCARPYRSLSPAGRLAKTFAVKGPRSRVNDTAYHFAQFHRASNWQANVYAHYWDAIRLQGMGYNIFYIIGVIVVVVIVLKLLGLY